MAYEAPTIKEAKEVFSKSIENEFNTSDTSAEIEQGVRTFIEWLKNVLIKWSKGVIIYTMDKCVYKSGIKFI